MTESSEAQQQASGLESSGSSMRQIQDTEERMIRELGPRIPERPRKGLEIWGGHHEMVSTSDDNRQRVRAEYDDISHQMRASIIKYGENGEITEQRSFRGDPGLRHFILRITRFFGGKKETVTHRVGLKFGPIDQNHIRPDTLNELKNTRHALEIAIPPVAPKTNIPTR